MHGHGLFKTSIHILLLLQQTRIIFLYKLNYNLRLIIISLCNGETLCFLSGKNWIFMHNIDEFCTSEDRVRKMHVTCGGTYSNH